MFKALIGDLFASEAQTPVHTVHGVGVMGKGVVIASPAPPLFDSETEMSLVA